MLGPSPQNPSPPGLPCIARRATQGASTHRHAESNCIDKMKRITAMNFIKRVNCGFVALGLCLAMAATSFGSVDYAGYNAISTTVDIGTDARIGPSSGNPGTLDILSGGSFTCDGGRVGENDDGTLNVQVGGSLHMDGEVQFNEGEHSGLVTRLNVYGTAYIEQLKVAREGNNDNKVVVGNGADAATLTIVEGYLGKYGDASITINAGSTMIITGDVGDLAWDDFYKIDANNVPTDSYIDLVGGTLKVADHGDASFFDHRIKGNGVLDAWVMTAGAGDDAGFDVYTAVAATSVPEPSTFVLAALGLLGLGWFGWRRKR